MSTFEITSPSARKNTSSLSGPRSTALATTPHDGESGQILLLVVLSLTMLLGFTALVVDMGHLMFAKRQLQTAADAAAVAGALEIHTCGTVANCVDMQNAAQSALTENGFTNSTLITQCGSTNFNGLTLVLDNGPCLLGANDPNYGNNAYVEALVSKPVPLLFAGILGFPSITINARSEAALGPPQDCVFAINPTASQAILVNGNGSMIAHCGTADDSSSSTALLVNGHADLTATSIHVHGGDLLNGNPTVSPTPQTNTPSVPDPLASLPAPNLGTCGTSTSSPFYGSKQQVTVNGNSSATFNPGTYCGGIQINGKAIATFNPGTYVIEGNVIFNGGDNIAGPGGVTFYMDTGQWIMNGNSHADLVAPTTGTYAGILIFQNPNDTSQFILNGDSTSVWQGAIYIPNANLDLNGGSNLAAYTILDVNTLTVNGNNTFTIGNDYSSLPNGPPISGTNAVMVE